MVNGLETFRDYFLNHSADYVLIGGVACELALNSLRLEFRPTDDFDIVIVSENLNQGFGEALKKFIQEGKYSVKRRQSNNKPTFFCFLSPQNDDFPSKLELATVKPYDEWEWDFAPLDAGDAKSSLSAILFEKDFYGFILDNKVDSNGISTMRLEGLIPLKCLAYLELSKESNPSPKVLANIEKHRQDIFRLAEVLPGGSFQLPTNVAEITKEALQLIASKTQNDEAIEILEMLRQFYVL
jgi:hypothetical protein